MITATIAPTTISPSHQATEIVSRRATVAGMQYTLEDSLGTHIVTVNHGFIGCTCGLDQLCIVCPHLLMVEAQEKAYAEEAARRAVYTDLFDIY